jgi:predicted ABC-type ATPase
LRLDLVVGPNGAGKSTLVAELIGPTRPAVLFVNADLIAAQRWPAEAAQRSYEAARIAERTRDALISAKQDFIAETVFSHPSKLALLDRAHEAGYTVVLHVVLVPLELSLLRVASRVLAGGHDVPEVKIRERFARLWPLVVEAMMRADHVFVWDNASIDGPREVVQLAGGIPLGPAHWPTWAPEVLTQRWP